MLRAPIPKIIRVLMGWDTGLPLCAGMVSFACFCEMPVFVFNLLPTSTSAYLAQHPYLGAIALLPLAAWMIWYAIQVAARMQVLVDSADDMDGWVLLNMAMFLIVSYKLLVDGMMQQTKALHYTESAVANVQTAVEAWFVLWFILVTYIAKAPWDRARAQATARMKKPSHHHTGKAK